MISATAARHYLVGLCVCIYFLQAAGGVLVDRSCTTLKAAEVIFTCPLLGAHRWYTYYAAEFFYPSIIYHYRNLYKKKVPQRRIVHPKDLHQSNTFKEDFLLLYYWPYSTAVLLCPSNKYVCLILIVLHQSKICITI